MPAYPLDFQTVRNLIGAPFSERLAIQRPQAVAESPFTGDAQFIDTFARWRLGFSFPRMRHGQAEQVAAWLSSLQGRKGTFYYRPKVAEVLTGLRPPLSASLFYPGNVAQLGGFAPNAATRLRPGRWFSIGDQLFRVTAAPANADGAGLALIEFEPYARMTYVGGTLANFVDPAGRFGLEVDEADGFELDPDRLPELASIMAVER